MAENSVFNLSNVKTFQLEQLAGKTLKIIKFKEGTSSVIAGVDTEVGCIYILTLVTGCKEG
jgi:hypothetical protein